MEIISFIVLSLLGILSCIHIFIIMINNAEYETEKNIKKYFDIPIKYCKFVLLIFYNPNKTQFMKRVQIPLLSGIVATMFFSLTSGIIEHRHTEIIKTKVLKIEKMVSGNKEPLSQFYYVIHTEHEKMICYIDPSHDVYDSRMAEVLNPNKVYTLQVSGKKNSFFSKRVLLKIIK